MDDIIWSTIYYINTKLYRQLSSYGRFRSGLRQKDGDSHTKEGVV